MGTAASKRSVMTLFGGKDELFSHQVRIVLAEKGVTYDTVFIAPGEINEELMELNPYNTIPVLVDRELVIYESRIINEYLDERFPHPPLMPVYPVARGRARLMMYRIEKDWYPLVDQVRAGGEAGAVARRDLTETVLSLAPVFAEAQYFLSDEFSLVDCCIAPLLWRLPSLGIELPIAPTKAMRAYMGRIFERESFQGALTDVERELRL
ncbi:MAG: stringent starvation protein A [Gammaproteobacteria bacterium]|nr:stringent starvation protein A [Gammaproteobacteria bacterium]